MQNTYKYAVLCLTCICPCLPFFRETVVSLDLLVPWDLLVPPDPLDPLEALADLETVERL